MPKKIKKDKLKKRKKNKPKWYILAVCNPGEEDDLEKVINFYSFGFEPIEIVVAGKLKNKELITALINSVVGLIENGDTFDENATHSIDDEHGNSVFVFDVSYGTYNDGTKWMQLVPDFDPHFIEINPAYYD